MANLVCEQCLASHLDNTFVMDLTWFYQHQEIVLVTHYLMHLVTLLDLKVFLSKLEEIIKKVFVKRWSMFKSKYCNQVASLAATASLTCSGVSIGIGPKGDRQS